MTPPLERRIAEQFTAIADNGWFPPEIEADSRRLAILRTLLKPGMSILDAGCARGRFLQALAPEGYGLDLTEAFLKDARHNVPAAKFTCASLTRMPCANASFDAVICIEALEHVPDTEAALREFARVLKPQGLLVIIDKSWTGLHPRTLIPNLLWKPWNEARGRWMYPATFPFREKWFWPRQLRNQLRNHFHQAKVIPLQTCLIAQLSFEAVWIATHPTSAAPDLRAATVRESAAKAPAPRHTLPGTPPKSPESSEKTPQTPSPPPQSRKPPP